MNTLDRNIELFAAHEPGTEQVGAAQRKLDAAVAARIAALPARAPARRVRGWLAAAVSAVLVALTILWLPLNPTPALAFAQVQEHFRDFRTMRFEIEQRVNGEMMMKSRVSVTRDGNVRTDVGDDVSVIVNSAEQRVLTLVHSARMAVVAPLDAPTEQEDSLAWLEDIRDFQGAATALPQTRVIDGQKVFGWELEIESGKLQLWTTDSGLPLEMTLGEGAPLQMRFHFEFDLDLAPQMFSTEIPAGYSLGAEED